ncbi:ras-related protein Rap-1b isoform X2 [Parasteatoda tepidariorum]|uniref:ras-related protein Rap-1b isoform X2 n=1 Tax=Parasteatoda tepidariorum TaxID=114398 RepID=UPI0039BCBE4B
MRTQHKIAIFGSDGVGKSSIVIRYGYQEFHEKLARDLEDDYNLRNFSENCKEFTKECGGFVLVYSLTDKSTFNDLQDLREQVLRMKGRDDVPIILVGNKCDLEDEREISQDEAANLAKLFNNCTFIESSAKDDINFSEIFSELVRQMIMGPVSESPASESPVSED